MRSLSQSLPRLGLLIAQSQGTRIIPRCWDCTVHNSHRHPVPLANENCAILPIIYPFAIWSCLENQFAKANVFLPWMPFCTTCEALSPNSHCYHDNKESFFNRDHWKQYWGRSWANTNRLVSICRHSTVYRKGVNTNMETIPVAVA